MQSSLQSSLRSLRGEAVPGQAEGPSGECALPVRACGSHPSSQRPGVREPQEAVLGHTGMVPYERELLCSTQQEGRSHPASGGWSFGGTEVQGSSNSSLGGGDVKKGLSSPPANPAQSADPARPNISMEDPDSMECGIEHLIQDLHDRSISEAGVPKGKPMSEHTSRIFPEVPGNAVALALSENMACGPRRDPDGVGEASQGITGSRCFGSGSVHLEMTLMVAGFIIGPRGSSIHSIADKTTARVTSFMKNPENGRIRVFVIEGSPMAILHAVQIILKAVVRYKELTEGQSSGDCVDAVQIVEGVEFLYRPPPRRRVPQAATIKSLSGERD